MPPKYSDSVRNTIETCLRAGVEPLQIASEVRVSHQWVYQLRQTLDAFDTVSPPRLGVQGHPRKITAEAEEGLLDFLNNNPSGWIGESSEGIRAIASLTSMVNVSYVLSPLEYYN
jgi:hypothetical protein